LSSSSSKTITANLRACDSVILAAVGHLAGLVALHAMADLCFSDGDLNRQWISDNGLLDILFVAFEE
jgi:hypothetical protein